MNYSDKDKEKIVPVYEYLISLEKTKGWEWLKNQLEVEEKKQLDILIEDDKINVDLVRGKIQGMKFIFKEIERIKRQFKNIKEEE